MGLRLRRPRSRAVSSPSRWAAYACMNSCTVMPSTIAMMNAMKPSGSSEARCTGDTRPPVKNPYRRRTRPRMRSGSIPPGPPMPRRANTGRSLWRSAARDAAEDEATRRDATRAPPERRADLLRRIRVRGLARDVDLRVRLATLHAIAHLRVQDDARPQIDGVAFLLAAGAQPDRCHADAVGGDGTDERGARRDEALDAWRAREPGR